MKLSSFEKERVKNINSTMDEIHDSSNDIYESLIDREYDLLKIKISSLIKKLRALLESTQDEL